MITFDDLKGINQFICEDNNQQSIIINENNLLSALSIQQWYEDDRLCAAALIRSITIGHGFQDGNKRTAAVAGMMLKQFDCSEEDMISCILDIAKGQLREVEDIANILYL